MQNAPFLTFGPSMAPFLAAAQFARQTRTSILVVLHT